MDSLCQEEQNKTTWVKMQQKIKNFSFKNYFWKNVIPNMMSFRAKMSFQTFLFLYYPKGEQKAGEAGQFASFRILQLH